MMQRMDGNGDGSLTQDELPEQMQDRFGELDANGDGRVEAAELSAGIGRLRAAGFGPPSRERPAAGAAP